MYIGVSVKTPIEEADSERHWTVILTPNIFYKTGRISRKSMLPSLIRPKFRTQGHRDIAPGITYHQRSINPAVKGLMHMAVAP